MNTAGYDSDGFGDYTSHTSSSSNCYIWPNTYPYVPTVVPTVYPYIPTVYTHVYTAKCNFCGTVHAPAVKLADCPRVKTIEFYKGNQVKRVEFYED